MYGLIIVSTYSRTFLLSNLLLDYNAMAKSGFQTRRVKNLGE